MVQNSEIRFKCTTEEVDKIKRISDHLGISIKEYILYTALNTEVKIEIKKRDIKINNSINKYNNKFKTYL